MKGQIGMEYMVILTLMITLLIPLFYIANERLGVSRTTSEAQAAMNAIVSSANTVYAQSPGSKLSTHIYIPSGYSNKTSYMVNRTIIMHFDLVSGIPYEVVGLTKGNVTGWLPPYPGYHIMTFALQQNGSVLINTTAK